VLPIGTSRIYWVEAKELFLTEKAVLTRCRYPFTSRATAMVTMPVSSVGYVIRRILEPLPRTLADTGFVTVALDVFTSKQ